jgi:putative flavoprotein involved in K+ transport
MHNYRRPEDVPEGHCLVVGTGQSGVQFMEDLRIAEQPDPKATEAKTNHCLTGRDDGHEIDLRAFARDGLPLYGSVSGIEGTTICLAPDLNRNSDDADKSYVGISDMLDIDIAVPEAETFRKVWRPEQEITEIDAHDQRITSVLWCIGFRPSDS